MATSKANLIKKGKELGLNLKSSMSMYELNARIKEAQEKAEKPKKETKPVKSKSTGEY